MTITLKKSRPSITYNIHICAIYLCNEKEGHSYTTQLSNFTDNISTIIPTQPLDKFIIIGDFNFGSKVEWQESAQGTELIPCNISEQTLTYFFDTISTYNLSQFNNQRNINNRLLDLVFSNDTLMVTECTEALATPIDAHHKPLCINANYIEIDKLEQKFTTKHMFNKGDYITINDTLNKINWYDYLKHDSLEDAVSAFYNKLYELRDKYIPVKTIKQQSHPPWYSMALIKALKEKYKYHRKYKTYNNLSDYLTFSYLRSKVQHLEKKML